MDSDKNSAAEASVSTSAPADGVTERRTTRRQEIRAALLAVPVVLTLTANANAAAGEYGYSK